MPKPTPTQWFILVRMHEHGRQINAVGRFLSDGRQIRRWIVTRTLETLRERGWVEAVPGSPDLLQISRRGRDVVEFGHAQPS